MQEEKKQSNYSELLLTNRPQFKYIFYTMTIFIGTWLVANVAAVKLVSIFGITLTGGFIVFPFTTMFGILIVEVYGYKNSRQAIWSGLILNLIFVFFISFVNLIPSPPGWNLNDQFSNILLPGTRTAIASLISFFISDFFNSYLIAKMKINSHGKSLGKRIMISSGIALIFDVGLFLLLAFYGRMPNSALALLIAYAYIKRIFCQLALLPVTLYLAGTLKKLEGVEIFDCITRFNPFLFDNIYELPIENVNDIQIERSIQSNETVYPCINPEVV